MNPSLRSLALFALGALLLICGQYTVPAQPVHLGTQRSSSSVPITGLSHIPELHTDMPLDCLIGYIAMDSAARTGSIPELLRTPPSLSLAHLRVPARYIYAMKDYDPILLRRHFHSTMDSAFPNERYGAFYANVYYPIIKSLWQRQEEFGRDYGLLVVSDYVLHVRVEDVRSGRDTTAFPPSSREWTNVACSIIEVFKGQRLPDNCVFINSHHKQKDKVYSASGCLVYGYPTRPEYTVSPGDEFIVFLDINPIKENLYTLYPNYSFGPHAGRFRIVNGKVEDPGNVFGLGPNPTVEDFKNAIRQRISTIQHWTFE